LIYRAVRWLSRKIVYVHSERSDISQAL
jgi:hypothetical protein